MAGTITCPQCGVHMDADILKQKLTQDILRRNKPDRKAGPQQFSVDCPNCRAKRIYVERHDSIPEVPNAPAPPA